MDSLEFTPNEEYLKLIEISEGRKVELALMGLTYRQLSKKKLFKEYGYELHHIEPRYRLKTSTTDYLNRPNNIAVLTTREHLLAHLYLAKFEVGKFRNSARMALIQLWSVKSRSDYLLNLPENELYLMLDGVEESRKNYFGSVAHIEGSSKAGKIAGAIRKERFENDPEFREYMLGKLKLSENRKIEVSASKKEKKDKSPPWLINTIKHIDGKNYKHKPQLWGLFDSIYEGLFKYNLSYKAIAKVLGVDYHRISNIVRIMKGKKEDFPDSFEKYQFYREFISDYRPTYLNSRALFEEYLEKRSFTGVYVHKASGKWTSQICVDGKRIHLGLFEDFNDALKARKDAEVKYFTCT